MKSLGLVVEIVGSCNLRCPSCPNNNMPDSIKNNNPSGLMSPELFEKILAKSTSEIRVTDLGLYNWGEPLLHNKLTEIIHIANSFNLPPVLSSNLNVTIDFDALIAAGPAKIHVSLSGFCQDTYSISHLGGDIELVKNNMEKLSVANEKYGYRTRLNVLFHLYNYNLKDAVLMKKYSANLGFSFTPYWAGWGSIEKKLQYVEDKDSLAANELRIAYGKMPFSYDEALRAIKSKDDESCNYQEKYIVINVLGNVQLCCLVYDSAKYTIGGLFDKSIAELYESIRQHDLCIKCKKYGFSKYPHNKQLINLALNNYLHNIDLIKELF